GAYQRVHDTHQQRGEQQSERAGDLDPGDDGGREPEPDRVDQQTYEEARHLLALAPCAPGAGRKAPSATHCTGRQNGTHLASAGACLVRANPLARDAYLLTSPSL